LDTVSLHDYLERCRRDMVERCTCCGNCTVNCEIRRHTAIGNVHPIEIVEAMKTYLASGRLEGVARDFAFACINCLECSQHCGEGIEASAMPLLTKARLVREGHDVPPIFKMTQPCQRYSVQSILSAMQVAPADVWWLDDVPESPERHEIVLFMGCNEMPFPSAMAAARDILTEMGLDFVSVGGGRNLCCGAVHMHTGEPDIANDMGRGLVESLERFKPDTIVLTCPTCAYVMEKTGANGRRGAPRYVHLAKFLAERVGAIQFKQSLAGRFTLQDPCFTARGLGDYESPRAVLSAIGGVELVEMEHNRENGLCCGVTALANNPPEVADAFIRNRLREAAEAKADTLVNVCAGCQMAFFRYENEYEFRVRAFSEVVAEAMGIALQPDMMKRFRDLADPARIVDAARGTIEAGPYDVDEIAAVLPFLFPGGT
jgi:Fe-S oxidoreductase